MPAPPDAVVGLMPNHRSGQVGLHSVLSALDVLGCFADHEELGVTDVARHVHVAKSTAHRLLATLAARGIVVKNPQTSRYRLGLALFELAWTAARHDPLRRLALPVLEELRERSGGTVELSVIDGVDVVSMERLESSSSISLLSSTGCRIPLHASGAGKVFAAYDRQLATARIHAGLLPVTPETVRDPVQFQRMLRITRSRGYDFSADECVSGLASVAAPVHDTAGGVLAVVSVSASTRRLRPAAASAARLVCTAARVLSGRLAPEWDNDLINGTPSP